MRASSSVPFRKPGARRGSSSRIASTCGSTTASLARDSRRTSTGLSWRSSGDASNGLRLLRGRRTERHPSTVASSASGSAARRASARIGPMAAHAVVGSAPAVSSRRWSLFIGLATLVVLADQATKALVAATYPVGSTSDVIGDLVRLAPSANSGAIFGLFPQQAWLFGLL